MTKAMNKYLCIKWFSGIHISWVWRWGISTLQVLIPETPRWSWDQRSTISMNLRSKFHREFAYRDFSTSRFRLPCDFVTSRFHHSCHLCSFPSMHTLILPSMTSTLCLLNLPTILCTISSELIELALQRLPKIHLMLVYYILPILVPYSLLYLPSMTSIHCLLNICQQSPPLALMATKALELFSPPLTSIS